VENQRFVFLEPAGMSGKLLLIKTSGFFFSGMQNEVFFWKTCRIYGRGRKGMTRRMWGKTQLRLVFRKEIFLGDTAHKNA